MAIPAHFSNRWQKYERKIRAQFYERKTWNSIFWKFLGNYMLENSRKLCAGKFGWVPAAFLVGVIMDQCKNMESDAGYWFLASVPIDGSDEQAAPAPAQRGAWAPVEQGMDASKSPEKRLVWVGRASEVSDAPSIGFEILRFEF